MAQDHITENEVLDLLKKSQKPLHFEQILKELGLGREDRKLLKKLLKSLKKANKITVERGRYKLTEEEIVTGTVIPYPAGFGFLQIGEGKKDIYIPPFEMVKVFGGDVVKARIVEFKGKKEIRIIKVLKRGKKEIICKIIKGKTCYGVPLYESPHQKIQLSKEECENLKRDTIVVVRIKEYPKDGTPAKGYVKEVIGHPEEKVLIIDLLVRKYDLPISYPDEVLKEAQKIKLNIKKELKRRDLRDQVCFTIDPERARDFDDAVAIEHTPEGHYRLWVHIADVSYFVKEGSHIDKEALRRGFTFYLPDRALHMLPEKLSSDVCSLKPNEDRLTFTCEMIFDKKGNLLSYDIYESVIRSKARLTYDEALKLIVGDPALEDKYPHLVKPLRLMEDLYRILAKKRWEKGSIDFDLPESEVVVDEFGEPVAVVPYERHVTHRIIEHFMISANEVVAMHLDHMGYPCLYRVHEKPDPEKVKNLLEILSGLGYRIKGFSLEPKFFQKIIEDFEGRPEENLVRFLTLRSMKRAYYSPHNVGHFGLALEHYAHFTSPIRRYTDIIVHRLLKKAIRGEDVPYEETVSYLEMVGQHLSMRERLADDVEREAIDLLKVRLIKAHLGETLRGIITGVVPFGFFVELQEYLTEGLVSISTLTDDQYIYDEPAHRLVGVRTGKVFRLGDVLRVRIVMVDEERGKIELELVEEER